jgi:hypothetical protein
MPAVTLPNSQPNRLMIVRWVIVLPPASPSIKTTATEQKNDDYNDQKRCHVHDFSVLIQIVPEGILDPAHCALNFAGRIFVATFVKRRRSRITGAS